MFNNEMYSAEQRTWLAENNVHVGSFVKLARRNVFGRVTAIDDDCIRLSVRAMFANDVEVRFYELIPATFMPYDLEWGAMCEVLVGKRIVGEDGMVELITRAGNGYVELGSGVRLDAEELLKDYDYIDLGGPVGEEYDERLHGSGCMEDVL